MGRYIYKPLVTYFDGDTEEKKFDFIRAYKDSLTSGELLVDLYNYEIYVANNGMEYPIPTTPELKEEIIKWIESEEGPLGMYSKNDLINSQVDKDSPSNIENKKERIKNLLTKIEAYKKACMDEIAKNENDALRMDRETQKWYNDLYQYTYNKVYTNNTDGSEIVRSLYEILLKYADLYRRIKNIEKVIEEIDKTDIDDSYKTKIQEIFKRIVDNSVAIKKKLDKSKIHDGIKYKTPDYSINFNFNKNLYTNDGKSYSDIDDKLVNQSDKLISNITRESRVASESIETKDITVDGITYHVYNYPLTITLKK